MTFIYCKNKSLLEVRFAAPDRNFIRQIWAGVHWGIICWACLAWTIYRKHCHHESQYCRTLITSILFSSPYNWLKNNFYVWKAKVFMKHFASNSMLTAFFELLFIIRVLIVALTSESRRLKKTQTWMDFCKCTTELCSEVALVAGKCSNTNPYNWKTNQWLNGSKDYRKKVVKRLILWFLEKKNLIND